MRDGGGAGEDNIFHWPESGHLHWYDWVLLYNCWPSKVTKQRAPSPPPQLSTRPPGRTACLLTRVAHYHASCCCRSSSWASLPGVWWTSAGRLASVNVHDVLTRAVIGGALWQTRVAHRVAHHHGCMRMTRQQHLGVHWRAQTGVYGGVAHATHVAHSHGAILHAWRPELRATVHQVARHGRVRTVRGTSGAERATDICSIRLIDHRLNNASPCINEPVIYLQNG